MDRAGQCHVTAVTGPEHSDPGRIQFLGFLDPVQQEADVAHGILPPAAVVHRQVGAPVTQRAPYIGSHHGRTQLCHPHLHHAVEGGPELAFRAAMDVDDDRKWPIARRQVHEPGKIEPGVFRESRRREAKQRGRGPVAGVHAAHVSGGPALQLAGVGGEAPQGQDVDVTGAGRGADAHADRSAAGIEFQVADNPDGDFVDLFEAKTLGIEKVQPADAVLVDDECAAPAVRTQFKFRHVPRDAAGHEAEFLLRRQRRETDFSGAPAHIAYKEDAFALVIEIDGDVAGLVFRVTHQLPDLARHEVEQVDPGIGDAAILLDDEEVPVAAETDRLPERTVRRLVQQPGAVRVVDVHDPDIVADAVSARRTVGQPLALLVPHHAVVERFAIGQQAGFAGLRVQQVDLVELAAAPIHGEGQQAPASLPRDLSNGFLEVGDLLQIHADPPDPVQLVDALGTGADIDALAAFRPVQHGRGADVLESFEGRRQLGRDLGDVLQDELAVVDRAPLRLRIGRAGQQEHHQACGQCRGPHQHFGGAQSRRAPRA